MSGVSNSLKSSKTAKKAVSAQYKANSSDERVFISTKNSTTVAQQK